MADPRHTAETISLMARRPQDQLEEEDREGDVWVPLLRPLPCKPVSDGWMEKLLHLHIHLVLFVLYADNTHRTFLCFKACYQFSIKVDKVDWLAVNQMCTKFYEK